MSATTEPLRVAIIGCGWAGQRHAWAYQQSGAFLRWAVDVDQQRAQSLARAGAGVQVTTDWQMAFADPDVDAVDVCLPHALHSAVAIAAAEAGKHILCEKPLAASLAEADRMIEAAARAGVVLMVAENARFSALNRKLRELLEAGVIGRPALVQMTRQCYLVRSFLQERPWFLDRQAAAGGIMMSGGIHDFETLRMLIGEIESIQALQARQRFAEMGGDDTSVALVRFRDGTVGTLVESFVMKSLTTASGPEVHTLRMDGDLGSLSVEDGHTIRLFSEREGMSLAGALTQHDLYVPEEDTFLLEVQHFVHCVRAGEEPITSGRSQRRPLEVVLAAYRSMESGGLPVTLP